MGLILCFSSAGFSLRQRFKTNRLSVGTTWKWFWWGFVQPSSHRCAQSIRVPSASEVSAGSVGGSDRRWGSQLCWLGFREAAHCFHYPTAYCASSNKRQSITCHSTHVNGALNVLPQETAKLPFLKWTVLTVQFGEGKKPQQHSYWLSLCSPIAVRRAFTSTAQQGTDVGWLKNLSLPLFYCLVTTEKFALIYFKSKWLDLHKTGSKSQFLMRTLSKDSV